jgi:hypothetical protein
MAPPAKPVSPDHRKMVDRNGIVPGFGGIPGFPETMK